jgi:DNA-binding response OmpR family regulator
MGSRAQQGYEARACSVALKLMIVDNDPEVLKLIRSVVEPLGYEVLTVTDSREAAERVNRQKFDGVVLVANMPHPDGYVLTQKIRESASNNRVPIAMLTEADDSEGVWIGHRAGATFFLAKPLDEKKFRNLLKVMHGAMVREKRSYIRSPVRIPVEWRAMNHFKGTSLNISERGILVEVAGNITVGEEVDLFLELAQARAPIEARAKVVRKEPPNRVALQFIELKHKDHKALQDFIGGIAEVMTKPGE